MMTTLKCPNCGGEIEYVEELDYEFDIDSAEFKETGHCPKCGKEYHWYCIYKFSHYEDLTED